MQDETRQRICTYMEQRLHTALLANTTIYIVEDISSYVLYEMFDVTIYRGRIPCISHTCHSIEEMIQEISKKNTIKAIHEESYFYCDRMLLTDIPGHISFQTLKEHHVDHLHQLKAECPPKEVEEADVNIDDYMVFGAFQDKKLVSAASVIYMGGAYDIGILTLPEYRGLGISTSLVQYCNDWILTQGGLSQYRCENKNIASYHTALKAGFEKEIRACLLTLEGE